MTFATPKINFWCKRPIGYEDANATTCWSYENSSKPCTEFEYDHSFYWSTIIEEFNLVCDRSWFASLAASIFQIGYGVSSIFMGMLSDKYGRLVALKTAVVLELVSGVSMALSRTIYEYLLARFFLGIGCYARFLTGLLLILEILGPKHRDRIRVFTESAWCLSLLLLPIIYYVVPHFRYVQLGVSAYELLFVYWLWTNVPESPRWQLSECGLIKW